MIDEKKLKETYGLSVNEYNAICERIYNLAEFEEKSGLVINRCNGTLKSTRKFLKKRLDTKKRNQKLHKLLRKSRRILQLRNTFQHTTIFAKHER